MPPAEYVRPPTPEYGLTQGQRWQLERKTASTVNVAREASLAFLEADANNDGMLTYVEFKDAIGRLRSRTGSSGRSMPPTGSSQPVAPVSPRRWWQLPAPPLLRPT